MINRRYRRVMRAIRNFSDQRHTGGLTNDLTTMNRFRQNLRGRGFSDASLTDDERYVFDRVRMIERHILKIEDEGLYLVEQTQDSSYKAVKSLEDTIDAAINSSDDVAKYIENGRSSALIKQAKGLEKAMQAVSKASGVSYPKSEISKHVKAVEKLVKEIDNAK